MQFDMRLTNQRGIYYVEIRRNKRKSLGTRDEKAAKAIFKEMEKEALRGRLFDLDKATRITLSDFTDQYLAYREGLKDLSRHTIKKDALSLKLLSDASGNTLLPLTDFEKFKNVCLTRGADKITVNGYLRHIKTAFKWALDQGYLKKPVKVIMYKRLKRPEADLFARILEPDQIRRFLIHAYKRSHAFGDYCLVTLWTGGRRRETLGLEYRHIDFHNARITLNGKTGSRTIPMMRPVKIVLQRNLKDIGRVFPDWSADSVSHWAQAAFKAAGIDNHRLHDLRHTTATYLLKNGVALEVVQRIMGHSQISTTQIYAKVLDGILKTEMGKLNFRL